MREMQGMGSGMWRTGSEEKAEDRQPGTEQQTDPLSLPHPRPQRPQQQRQQHRHISNSSITAAAAATSATAAGDDDDDGLQRCTLPLTHRANAHS